METIVEHVVLSVLSMVCAFFSWRLVRVLYDSLTKKSFEDLNKLNDLLTWALIMKRSPKHFNTVHCTAVLTDALVFAETRKLSRRRQRILRNVIQTTITTMATCTGYGDGH
jgi:hypothetical protein